MSPGSIREYMAALRERYRRGGRKAKDRLLDEVAAVTGYHRKSAQRRKEVQILTINRRKDYNQGLREIVNAA